MNTNMTELRWFSKNLCILVLWTQVASALEWLRVIDDLAKRILKQCVEAISVEVSAVVSRSALHPANHNKQLPPIIDSQSIVQSGTVASIQ